MHQSLRFLLFALKNEILVENLFLTVCRDATPHTGFKLENSGLHHYITGS